MAETEDSVLKVGRASDNDVVVSHASVSAHHAELRQDGSQYRLVDLSSSNGTFVNGVRVPSQVLNEGDVVHLGPVGLEFRNGCFEIGIREEPDPNQSMPSDRPPTSRKAPLTVWVLVLVAAAVAIVISLSGGGEGEKPFSASPATTTVPTLTQTPATEEVNWKQLAHSVVLIEVVDCGGDAWAGSGTVDLDGGHVLTNHHVVTDEAGGVCDP
ncbi:uncharacterized protein METZ01_LOCUS368264, partial [marine metagenome]